MDILSTTIAERGSSRATIGVDMDNCWFSAKALAVLSGHLPNARFADATALVNWQRAVKSRRELDYMRRAPDWSSACTSAFVNGSNRACANAIWSPTSTMPLCATTKRSVGAPHLTWDDKPMRPGEGTFFEITGVYRHYHCPLSRTVIPGKPTETFRNGEKAVLEVMEAGLEAARAGNSPPHPERARAVVGGSPDDVGLR